jgi:hypothetical protein
MPEAPNRGLVQVPPTVFQWHAIDRSMVRLKLTDLSIEMNRKTKDDIRRIQFDNRLNMNTNTVPSAILRMHEERTDEWAGRIYQIYCDVWKAQGNVRTAAFVRAVFARAIRMTLTARSSAIRHQFGMWARRTGFHGGLTNAHLNAFDLRMQRLKDRWFRRTEIEAKELEHAEKRERLAASVQIRSILQPTQSSQALIPSTPSPKADDPTEQDSRREVIIHKVHNPQQFTILSIDHAAIYFEVTPRTICRWV